MENVSQDQPMKNIVFDGVRVLQAGNSDLEKYHTCKGEADKNLEKYQNLEIYQNLEKYHTCKYGAERKNLNPKTMSQFH